MSQVKNGDVCEYNKLKRPHYFHGMLLDEKDFEAEQTYHVNKRRIFNRMLHGSGVICGLGLKWKKWRNVVTVTPGLALDCCGREIWISDPYSLDLTKLLSRLEPSFEPDCTERTEGGDVTSYWLCLSYTEAPSDLVPVYASGADCKSPTCSPSRIKEGYCFHVHPARPCSPADDGLLHDLCHCDCNDDDARLHIVGECPEADCVSLEGDRRCKCQALANFCSEPLPCPECSGCGCENHGVVLGRLDFNKKNCLTNVCINDCRAYVLTGRMIQSLLISVLSGSEDWLRVQRIDHSYDAIPDATRLVENPIFALCWALRRFVLEQGRIERTGTRMDCLKDLRWEAPEVVEEAEDVTYEYIESQIELADGSIMAQNVGEAKDRLKADPDAGLVLFVHEMKRDPPRKKVLEHILTYEPLRPGGARTTFMKAVKDTLEKL